MNFEIIVLKNGKFDHYDFIVVPSYDAYEWQIDVMNAEAKATGSEFSYMTA